MATGIGCVRGSGWEDGGRLRQKRMLWRGRECDSIILMTQHIIIAYINHGQTLTAQYNPPAGMLNATMRDLKERFARKCGHNSMQRPAAVNL